VRVDDWATKSAPGTKIVYAKRNRYGPHTSEGREALQSAERAAAAGTVFLAQRRVRTKDQDDSVFHYEATRISPRTAKALDRLGRLS
jgi:hypothetical protein